jgi:hypothetical protein
MPKHRGNRSRSWSMERTTVHTPGKSHPRSNKYRPSPSDSTSLPAPGTRKRYWRGGYTRKDGTHVQGHYVNNPNHED